MKASKRRGSKRTDRKVAQYGRNAAAMLRLAKGKARHWTVFTAAVASGFTMAEAESVLGIPSPGTVVGASNSIYLSNAAEIMKFARIEVGSSNKVVFSAMGVAGRGFLGTNAALDTFGVSEQVSLTAPAVGTVTFNSTTNNLPTTGIIGFRTGDNINNPNAVTGLIDFTIDFDQLDPSKTTVTVNNFWYDEDASVDADGDGFFFTAHIPSDPPVTVVPVPKAVSLGLLAFGAAGITTMRRRRQELATS